jgi:hypothetical protein
LSRFGELDQDRLDRSPQETRVNSRAAATVRIASTVGAGALLIALTACTGDPTGGNGTPAAASSTASSTSAPTSSPAAAPTAAGTGTTVAASASATVTPTPTSVVTITGSGTLGGTYQMSLWANDVINDCVTHSHGTPIVSYFTQHPCRSATRRLWTTPINGRTLALSIVSVSAQIGKINENPDYQYAQQLVTLENADGTGSVNDLLREGKRIAGAGTAIPSNEVFSVVSQDGLVVIIDGWYLSGSTNPNDANLLNIETDLAFSDASAPDGQ